MCSWSDVKCNATQIAAVIDFLTNSLFLSSQCSSLWIQFILLFSLLKLLYFYFSEKFPFSFIKNFHFSLILPTMTSYTINFFFPFILFHFFMFLFVVVLLVSVFWQEALSFTFEFSFECVFIFYFFRKKIIVSSS